MRRFNWPVDQFERDRFTEQLRCQAVNDYLTRLAPVRDRTDRAQRFAGENMKPPASCARQNDRGEVAGGYRQPVPKRNGWLDGPEKINLAQSDGSSRRQYRVRR